jgi:creatinine amidohydrolase
MADAAAWRRGHAVLEQRTRALPALLHEVLRADAPHLPWSARHVRRVVTTGAGSSAANARLLAALLQDAGLAARFVPLTSFAVAPPADAIADALVVFSQGLSPNARLALHDVEAWAGVLVVTAVPERAAARDAAPPPSGALGERRRLLADLVARGVHVHRIPAAEEYGTLLRVTGPMLGTAVAIAIARAAAASAGAPRGLLPDAIDADAVCARVADAPSRLAREHPDLGAASLDVGCALLASAGYADLLGNLRAKVVEGPLLPEPPAWDLLDFAHGPFQQLHARRATLFALTRLGAPGEAELLARLESMLVPERHRLVRWHSDLPGALALLEHEALMNALMLRAIAERGVDQVEFPGRGDDRPLYDVAQCAAGTAPAGAAGDVAPSVSTPAATVPAPAAPLLARLTWPDVDALVASGTTTALLPLGSTEQHGPHLPFATDSVIAAAVAERVAARLGETLVLPVLPLGCADEHMAFPGTLSLAEATLIAIVRDVAIALRAHGFARLLVFTAHGGNYRVLRALGSSVASDVVPLRIAPFLDFACLTETLERTARGFGVDADAAGQHAGEIETSIVLQESPRDVRRDRLARGLTGTTLAPDELFYPDLRRHAADGTVGDPRGARATRGEAYLDAWAGLLAASWSAPDAKKRK